jgi:hypothetical protein
MPKASGNGGKTLGLRNRNELGKEDGGTTGNPPPPPLGLLDELCVELCKQFEIALGG